MGAIAALMSKDGSDVCGQIGSMLRLLEHRGRDWVRVSISGQIRGGRSVDEADCSDLRGSTALAEAHLKRYEGEGDPNYPEGLFTAVDGRLYGLKRFEMGLGFPFHLGVPEAEIFGRIVVQNLGVGLVAAVQKALSELDGVYAVAAAENGRMVFGRDPLGVKSLYYGENETLFGLASERKALWDVGIWEAHSFPPGTVGELVQDGMRFHPFSVISKPEIESLTLEDASVRLEGALRLSFAKRLTSVGEVALSFSGGVDSSVAARMIADSGCGVLLCVVGLEGCHDIVVAEDSAKALGINIEVRPLRIDEVVDYVRKVVYAVEESDLMKIGVGLPLYVASETVGRRGFGFIFSGQGSDELFCGYNKYMTVLDRMGYEGLEEEMWRDVTRMYEVNLQRDDAVTAANGVRLEVPFMDLDLVKTAAAFPVSLNVTSPDDPLRKRVLRRMAERIGLPRRIVDMPKKSAQYGSGIDSAMRSIARAGGFRSVREYLNSVFREVFQRRFVQEPH